MVEEWMSVEGGEGMDGPYLPSPIITRQAHITPINIQVGMGYRGQHFKSGVLLGRWFMRWLLSSQVISSPRVAVVLINGRGTRTAAAAN